MKAVENGEMTAEEASKVTVTASGKGNVYIGDKGGLCIRHGGRYPVHMYVNQLVPFLGRISEALDFVIANQEDFTFKDENDRESTIATIAQWKEDHLI